MKLKGLLVQKNVAFVRVQSASVLIWNGNRA